MKNDLPECPVQITLSLMDNKWKVLIIGELLFEGMHRFTELKKALPKISQKVLTSNLRSLEEDGIVIREVFAEVPLRVEYSLTELGNSLRPIIDSMMQWGEDYRAKVSG